jgi:hypothetical protein
MPVTVNASRRREKLILTEAPKIEFVDGLETVSMVIGKTAIRVSEQGNIVQKKPDQTEFSQGSQYSKDIAFTAIGQHALDLSFKIGELERTGKSQEADKLKDERLGLLNFRTNAWDTFRKRLAELDDRSAELAKRTPKNIRIIKEE